MHCEALLKQIINCEDRNVFYQWISSSLHLSYVMSDFFEMHIFRWYFDNISMIFRRFLMRCLWHRHIVPCGGWASQLHSLPPEQSFRRGLRPTPREYARKQIHQSGIPVLPRRGHPRAWEPCIRAAEDVRGGTTGGGAVRERGWMPSLMGWLVNRCMLRCSCVFERGVGESGVIVEISSNWNLVLIEIASKHLSKYNRKIHQNTFVYCRKSYRK